MSNTPIINWIGKNEQILFEKLLEEWLVKFDEEKKKFFTYTEDWIISNLSVRELISSKSLKFSEWANNQNVICDELWVPLVLWHWSCFAFEEFHYNPNWIYFAWFSDSVLYAKNRLEEENGWYISNIHGFHLCQCFLKVDHIKYLNRQKYRDIDISKIRADWYDWVIAYNTRDSAWTYHQYIVKNPSQIFTIQIS